MSRIEKECAQERVQKPNLRLWSYLRPVLYMAASFLIVIAGFKLLEWQTGRVKSLPIAEQPVTQNDLSIETEAYYDFLTEDDYLARAYLPEDAF
ncbi:hypothetical protein HQ45_07045 [Porphyromonas crevioricanis]|nr:hypothetical protein HQ45_07045 [Porphyromonas crevioricanis]KGN93735.1 hypothetical protein HQ38_08100 [Porphyromonas crevioricanis]